MGGWSFKKEVSIGDIIAFATAVIAVVFAYTTLDKRLGLLEHATAVQKERDAAQDLESLRYQARIEESLRGLNNKLDRLIERR
jgi:hypothetical protein